ncbi:MAG: DNA primase [Cyclobacteriaceae bacterium]|nr:DNA primase [Cyclobacteriaceae bacterium]
MISRQTIDEIRNRIDIVDVVSDFVSLKRSGQNYKALSPFTNEKTPSFYVVPSKGIFKDFSSGKGGDGITFVMEHEGMSYVEALKYLAKKYGVEIKEDERTPEDLAAQGERDSLYIVMTFAKDYYKELLHNHDEGRSIGLSYFRERGFNDRILEKFELGYSLNEWHHLQQAALTRGFSENVLEKSGLIIKKDDKIYDRFRGRVIFPVHNLSGKVVAFGARILTKEKDQPKYINSPETEIYHKSNVLYGMYQAKNEIRKHDFCYLVEGYTDVISLHLSGIENVVASSGTALTEEQIRLMRRFTENVTVLFDGDAAGIKAALRGIDLVLKGGLNVRVVLLPDGEDPDSYSKKMGSTEFQEYLKTNSKDFISFKIDLLSAGASNNPIKRAEAIREIVASIALIPDPIKRSVYIKETGDLLKIQESVLLTELNKILIAEKRKRDQERMREEVAEPLLDVIEEVAQATKTDPQTMVQMQEREVIRLLLNYSDSPVEDDVDLVSYFINEFEELDFFNPLYASIFKMFRDAKLNGELVDSKYLIDNGSEEVKRLVAELTVKKYQASKYWREKYHIIFFDENEKINENAHQNVLRRKYRYIQNLLEENKAKIKEAESSSNSIKVDELILVQHKLKQVDLELATELGVISGKY